MKENLYQAYDIAIQTLDEYPAREQRHSFFELVFILNGTGTQCVNNNRFDYYANHMLLLAPDDCHKIEIGTSTKFFFLRFNDIYLKSGNLHIDNVKRLEYILQNATHQPGCILKHQPDKALVRPIIEAIEREYTNTGIFNKELVQHLVNTLIIIVARNIAIYLPENVNEQTEEKVVDILQYIQANIYDPAKIKAEHLSRHFGISDTYLGRYFRKHTGETMQQYIINYRTNLITVKLCHSSMRISEIAGEMGFTDESHMNKFFKKQKGISPTEFRRMHRQIITTAVSA